MKTQEKKPRMKIDMEQEFNAFWNAICDGFWIRGVTEKDKFKIMLAFYRGFTIAHNFNIEILNTVEVSEIEDIQRDADLRIYDVWAKLKEADKS